MAPKLDDHSERSARQGEMDERIAESRNQFTNTANTANSNREENGGLGNSNRGTTKKGNNGPRMIEDDDALDQKPTQEQADLEAKRKARASSSRAQASVVARSPPPRSIPFDKERQAKELAKTSSSRASLPADSEVSTNRVKSFTKLDREIEVKAQARRAMVTGTMTAKKPPARGVMTTTKDRPPKSSAFTATDSRSNSNSRKGPALIPGVYEERHDNDSRINKKNSSGSNNGKGTLSTDIVFGGAGDDNKASIHGLDAGNAMVKHEGGHVRAGVDARFGGNQDHPKKTSHSAGVRLFGADDNDDDAYVTSKKEKDLEGGLQDTRVGGSDTAGNGGFGEIANMTQGSEFEDLGDNALAVAREVVEVEGDDTFIPAAVEFDPDAKPPLYKNRRFRFYSCLASLLALVVILAVVIPTQVINKGKNKNDGPTSAPTSYRESLGIQDQLEMFVGTSKLNDVDSPYYRALDWLLHEDEMQLSLEADNLLQRYIMALFYFQTSMEGPWVSCNPPTGNQTEKCVHQSLQVAVPEYVYAPEPDSIRWLSGKHECEWVGVGCSVTDEVLFMVIEGQALTGGFPVELGLLPNLVALNLYANKLSGPLPKEIAGTMDQLEDLLLAGNLFNGTVPSEFFTFRRLRGLLLQANRLTGALSMPPTGTSDTLEALYVEKNDISSTIPTEIAALSSLAWINLSNNNISGPIPSEVGLLSDLSELRLNELSISGVIPSELGALERLQHLRLHYTSLSGPIPDELYNLPAIERIDLFNTNITGTISTLIGQLTTLQVLRLSGTKNLSGTIPSEMGLLTELTSLWLEHSGVTGSIPDNLCQLRSGSEPILYELSADCSLSQNSGFAAVSCPNGCCTQCCEQETETCEDMLKK